jgi:hypothetical protein
LDPPAFGYIARRGPVRIHGVVGEGGSLGFGSLARFFALLKYIEEPWRLKGTPEFEVRGLAGLVSENWEWSMKWPLEVLGCVLEIVE